MKHNVKTTIETSEQIAMEYREIKVEDMSDSIMEAFKKAELEGAIIDSCPAVKFDLSENVIEEIRRRM